MNTTMLIKTDKKLKQEAQKIAKNMGLPLSTVINNYLKEFIATQEVVFTGYTPNKKTARMIDQARKDHKEGKTIGPFKTVSEAIAFLNKNR